MTNTAGESSARGSGDAPAPPEAEHPAPSSESSSTPSASSVSDEQAVPARSSGVRWADDAHPAADADATPPSGTTVPGPGEAVPARTTGPVPEPTPAAAWPPGFRGGPWQQTAPGWAPPPSAPPPDPARRRRTRRIVLGVVLAVVVLALVVVALLAFLVGPRFARYDVLDRAALERGVTDVVTRDWKRQVGGVSCPDDERVRPGTTFTCTGTVDGRPMRIPVDVVDDAGTYEVGQPR
ncbi:DUF4333 domain-containing protein [Actinomycetospora soli]|uniref:DUF4333 domain-containing protein n=1 Tax=Actinomycetospora soli TaxID=2893887 RepID=UPI001E45886A|nr:DUF4333 domain-containing protein [Actinomycetospora soli]MCD2187487.1 DUF4333 domain-containing protein [Actinomycetospora soli]